MKAKTLFYCTECGNEMPKWQGKCPACGAWNTVVAVSYTHLDVYKRQTFGYAVGFIILIVILLVKPAGIMGKLVIEKV